MFQATSELLATLTAHRQRQLRLELRGLSTVQEKDDNIFSMNDLDELLDRAKNELKLAEGSPEKQPPTNKATLKHLELLTAVCKQFLYTQLREHNQSSPQADLVRKVEDLSTSMANVRQHEKGGD